MRLTPVRAAALLLSLSACAGFPFLARSVGNASTSDAPAGARPSSSRALVEMQNIGFDGEALSGRILVGVEEGTLTLDQRLVVNASLQVRSVTDCATGQSVDFLLDDSFPAPAREEDVITLSPGQWYGANVRFMLFDRAFTQKSPPDCIKADIWLRTADGQLAGQLAARAEWNSRREVPDAGEATKADDCAAGMDSGCAHPLTEVDVQP
jgi:hypothetical protein